MKLTEGECVTFELEQTVTLRRLLPSHRQRKNEIVYWYSGVPPSFRRKAFITPRLRVDDNNCMAGRSIKNALVRRR